MNEVAVEQDKRLIEIAEELQDLSSVYPPEAQYHLIMASLAVVTAYFEATLPRHTEHTELLDELNHAAGYQSYGGFILGGGA